MRNKIIASAASFSATGKRTDMSTLPSMLRDVAVYVSGRFEVAMTFGAEVVLLELSLLNARVDGAFAFTVQDGHELSGCRVEEE